MINIYTDGGCRLNGKICACGVYFPETKSGFGFYLQNNNTNNQAEYMGVYKALLLLTEGQKKKNIQLYLDSKLVVQQLNGEWDVKDKVLKDIFIKIKQLNIQFSCKWIPREQNKQADMMVNMSQDKKQNTKKIF